MNEKTIKTKQTYKIVLMILLVFIWSSNIFSQDFSNGTLDFIFQPNNNWTQIVIWLENESGEYVQTVYLTAFIGRRQ